MKHPTSSVTVSPQVPSGVWQVIRPFTGGTRGELRVRRRVERELAAMAAISAAASTAYGGAPMRWPHPVQRPVGRAALAHSGRPQAQVERQGWSSGTLCTAMARRGTGVSASAASGAGAQFGGGCH
jgi:hypothetical protein